MSRDYTHEDWIPWYVRDSAGWLELSLAARGAAEGIARKMGRDKEELPLGSRGLRGLSRTLGCKWEELEPALDELLRPGPDGEPPRLVYDRDRNSLRDPGATHRRRPTSTKRVQSLRQRRETETDETRETVPPVSPHPETGVTVPSNLFSSDLKSSEIPEEIPSPREGPARPLWFDGVCDTVETQLPGETIDRPAAWLRYEGHRNAPESTKGMSPADARYWLTSVDIKDARKARAEAARQRERDAKFDRARGGFVEPQKITPEQQKQLVEKYPMRTRRELDEAAEKRRKGAA